MQTPEGGDPLYTAGCNPPRRTKRPSSSLPTSTMAPIATSATKPIAILPKAVMRADQPPVTTPGDPHPAHTPAKRGRKPGPLSRAAREAQRRLNHSIIEKARRTKINDALATLRQLVPPQYGQAKSNQPEDEEEDEEEDEYRPSAGVEDRKPGKKEQKEKEFKLEILVRTVAYMKDLIKRVGDLEAESAQSSGNILTSTSKNPGQTRIDPPSISKKRAHDDEGSDDEPPRYSRRARRDSCVSQSAELGTLRPAQEVTQLPSIRKPFLDGPLPPISSWLSSPAGNAARMPRRDSYCKSPSSYLPSPPSSINFDPVRPAHVPPSLSLGPSRDSICSLTSHTRTPEDESAASLLLQIATSPAFRPMPDDSSSIPGLSRRLSLSEKAQETDLIPLNHGSHHSGSRREHRANVRSVGDSTSHIRRIETPASLLGIRPVSRPH